MRRPPSSILAASQARALAGDDGEGDGEDSSMDAVRRKLGHLHKRHASLREKLTHPSPPQKSLVVRMQVSLVNRGWCCKP